MEEHGELRPWQNAVTAELAEIVARRDDFYVGTANGNGQPYVQ